MSSISATAVNASGTGFLVSYVRMVGDCCWILGTSLQQHCVSCNFILRNEKKLQGGNVKRARGVVDHSHIFNGHIFSLFLLVRVSNQGTNVAETCCLIMPSVIVCQYIPYMRPNLPAILKLVLYWSSLIL
jgi:hypothetical protein